MPPPLPDPVEPLDPPLEDFEGVVAVDGELGAIVVLDFGWGSGMKGSRVAPPRCRCAPLVVSETATLGFAGAGVATVVGAGGNAGATATVVEELEEPPGEHRVGDAAEQGDAGERHDRQQAPSEQVVLQRLEHVEHVVHGVTFTTAVGAVEGCEALGPETAWVGAPAGPAGVAPPVRPCPAGST